MGSLFYCKFCKEEIVDSNYIDKRKPPVFDDIYHKDCEISYEHHHYEYGFDDWLAWRLTKRGKG